MGKIVTRTVTINQADGREFGVIRLEIYWGDLEPHAYGYVCSFPEDQRPFELANEVNEIAVDRANFDPPELDQFLHDTQAIFPERSLEFVGRKAVEAESVLWLSASLAVLLFAKKIPFVGAAITAAEEAIIEELRVKERVKELIRAFGSRVRKKDASVQATFRENGVQVVLIASIDDMADAIDEGEGFLIRHTAMMRDAASVQFTRLNGEWAFQYAVLKSGNVLMSAECYRRTLIQLTNAGKIIYPEQFQHLSVVTDFPADQASGHADARFVAPNGNVILNRKVFIEKTGSSYSMFDENGDTIGEIGVSPQDRQ